MPQPFSLTGGNMKYSGVGGQAVMEGVMMKNEDRYAVAVRKPDHTIDVKVSTFKETIKNKKLRRLPFIRGVINFIESLILGMQTLMYSASFFEDDEDEKKKKEAMTQEERKAQEEKEKKQVKIDYKPEAYFLQDLHRHMYLKGIVNAGMTDFTFEIDDDRNPYWVTTLYEHKVGYSGASATGGATVIGSTGETKRYSINDAPKWIDRIQPESFVVDQINDWGLYVKGFLNSVISEEGVLVATEGTSLVYGTDGKAYWYTGITSAGGDESTIGFMLVDTRTKEAKLYKQPGATETAAMTSAEGKVQEKNYQATFPVMYNILGKPTYVMSLKDKAGLVKMVSFVSVEDYSVLGLGENKEEALRNYREALASKGNSIKLENDETQQTIEGTITRINQDVQSGNTFYYLTIDTDTSRIFNAMSKVSSELPLTQVGDKVKLSYQKEAKGLVDINEFDNLNILNVEVDTTKQ